MEKYDYIWVEEITYTLGVFRKLLEGYEGADPGDHWGGTDAPDAWECGEDSRGEGLSRPPPFFFVKKRDCRRFLGVRGRKRRQENSREPKAKKTRFAAFFAFFGTVPELCGFCVRLQKC